MDINTEEHVYSISRVDFFEEWLKHTKNERNSRIYDYLSSKFHFGDITEGCQKEIELKISNFSNKIGTKWLASGKSKERFLVNNKNWLDEADIQFTASSYAPQPSTSSEAVTLAGRARKDLEDSSFKMKKRRVVDLLESRSVSELVTAPEIAVRSAGQREIVNVIRDMSERTDNIVESKNTSFVNPRFQFIPSLAYYIDSKSTTHSYKKTRKWSMKAGHKVFPSYCSLVKSKQACYPAEEHIVITETRAEINLQALLNKTVERLVLAHNEVITSVLPTSSSFTLVSKWGWDGSSGHSTYKQRFENTEDTDEFLFVFSLVPLKLHDGSKIIWQNPRPSSTLYCRPIKFIFAKETNDFTLEETNRLLEEVNALLSTLVNFGDSQISVKHELLLTMTDGNVCNALTETRSSQKCFICGATPKTMNDDPATQSDSNQEHFGFGLSTLHAWIRCFECLLHISYKLNIKKWQARSNEEKADIKVRSDEIRLKFKNEMGLIVDKPKPGFGSSNDANTARRFFKNAEMSAHITGLDVKIIKQFDVILRTLSSGFEINLVEFNKFCLETRRHYLSLYSWYFMPATVHKILIHSTEVIKAALLPIGQLSEEVQEARNKDCRRFRKYNTRKCSRVATNRDLLFMFVITSDPLINSLRQMPQKKPEKICTEVLKLIVSPSIVESRPKSSSYCRTMSQNDDDYTVNDSSEDSDDDY